MKKRLGEMLIEAGVIDEAQLQAALGHQRRWGGRIGQALVHLNLAHEDDVVDALGRKFGFESVRLDMLDPVALEQALALVPRDVAVKNHVFPAAADSTSITVAMSDPSNVAVVDELGFRTGRRVVVKIAGELAIGAALRAHYGGGPRRPGDVEAIALDLDSDGGESMDTLLDPFGGGSSDELEAFFTTSTEATREFSLPPAPALEAPPPAGGLELEDAAPEYGEPLQELTEVEDVVLLDELPAEDDLLPSDALQPAELYDDAPPLEPTAAPDSIQAPSPVPDLGEPWHGDAWAEDPWAAAPEPVPAPPPAPAPVLFAPAPAASPAPDAYAPDPVAPDPDADRLTDQEFAILDALDRIASGVVEEEPSVVNPAQVSAALVRLLIRKGIVTDQEFLDELLKR